MTLAETPVTVAKAGAVGADAAGAAPAASARPLPSVQATRPAALSAAPAAGPAAASAADARPATPTLPAYARQRALSVTIVDDDEDLGLLLVRGLKRMGVPAHLCCDLASLRDHVADSPGDAIAMDLNLDDGDGVDIMEFLAKAKYKNPIVLMSGCDMRVLSASRRIGEGLGLNIVGILRKPFPHRDLVKMLHQAAPSPATLGEDDLREAISLHHIVPFMQPILDGRSGQVVGAEALARWQHPRLGLVPPDRFIDLAEKSNLMDALTEEMLYASSLAWARLNADGHRLTIAVNISASSLRDAAFTDRAWKIITDNGMDPNCLKLEVTESVAMDQTIAVSTVLTRMRIKGFSLALDDFGTGHSSLVSLHRLPFAELKIDKSFVLNLPNDKDGQIIVKALIDLAHNLGQKIVAEGVENQDTIDILQSFGCDFLQGYYFSKPLPLEHFRFWVAAYNDAIKEWDKSPD